MSHVSCRGMGPIKVVEVMIVRSKGECMYWE